MFVVFPPPSWIVCLICLDRAKRRPRLDQICNRQTNKPGGEREPPGCRPTKTVALVVGAVCKERSVLCYRCHDRRVRCHVLVPPLQQRQHSRAPLRVANRIKPPRNSMALPSPPRPVSALVVDQEPYLWSYESSELRARQLCGGRCRSACREFQ